MVKVVTASGELDYTHVVGVLDHGSVYLVEAMGTDNSVVQAARVSYGRGTKTQREDRALIRYLMRNEHTSPFEMIQLKWHIKLPLFVANQWVRHRTGSFNFVSYRYSEAKEEFYVPDEDQLREQSGSNKQGRGERLSDGYTKACLDAINDHNRHAYQSYRFLLESGLTRELARLVLPQNVYTEFYWSVNLHNWFRFHKLRSDSHAQWEIQQYAKAMELIISESFPLCWEAYNDYGRKWMRDVQDTQLAEFLLWKENEPEEETDARE